MNTEENKVRNDLVWETIPLQIPSKKNNYEVGNNKHGQRYIIKSQRLRDYEKHFLKECKIYKNKNINRPCKLYAIVYESSWAWDVDNALGTLCDCLQYSNCITNDNLIISIDIRKVIDPHNPRVSFALQEIEPRINF